MTDRLKGVLVTFDHDIRVDDVEPLIAAIQQLRGVLDVSEIKVNPDDYMNRARVANELRSQLIDVLFPAFGKE